MDKKKNDNDEYTGASWGFREDAVNDYEDLIDENHSKKLPDYVKNDPNYNRKYGEIYSASIDDTKISEKDKDIIEKIKIKERKIQNMQEEIKRIYLKENRQEGILTDGQQAVITRNDKQIAELIDEIEILQQSLSDRINNRDRSSGIKTDSKLSSRKAYYEDDDNIIDTTSQTVSVETNWRLKKKLAQQKLKSNKSAPIATSNSGSSTGSLSYEDLSNQKAHLSRKMSRIRHQIEEISCNTNIVGTSRLNKSSDDNIDAVLQTIQSKEREASLQILLKEEKNVFEELGKVNRLLRIVTPALASLVPSKPTTTMTSSSKTNSLPKSSSVAKETVLKKESYQKISVLQEVDNNNSNNLTTTTTTTTTNSMDESTQSNSNNNSNVLIQQQQQQHQHHQHHHQQQQQPNHQLDNITSSITIENNTPLSIIDDRNHNNSTLRSTTNTIPSGSIVEKPTVNNESTTIIPEKNSKVTNIVQNIISSLYSTSTSTSSTLPSKDTMKGKPFKPLSYNNHEDEDVNENNTKEEITKKPNTDTKSDSIKKRPLENNDILSTNKNTTNNITITNKSKKIKGAVGPSRPHTNALLQANKRNIEYQEVDLRTKKTLEGGEAVWVPPPNQTGDGKTALNAKYGY